MAYTPPAYNAVNFAFSGSYSPPAHGSVNFNFLLPVVNGTIAATLADVTASIAAGDLYIGTLAATLDNITASMAAHETFNSTLAATLDNITASVTASAGRNRRTVIINS